MKNINNYFWGALKLSFKLKIVSNTLEYLLEVILLNFDGCISSTGNVEVECGV